MKCPRCQSDNPDSSRFCGSCAAPLGPVAPEAPSLTRTLETPVSVFKPGALIAGKYKILDEIGRGGMGVVYKAEDIKLKRSVALKFLPPHLMDSPELKERFLIEAQAAAALNHPNICVIHEVGESEERSYIAMENVEGETLRDKIRKGVLKAEDALAVASQVAAGLGEAHRKGIVHRDVKSANIMVTAKGQAKIMDFGLAKLRGGSSLTKSQTTLGTVAYMSPEQARGDDLDQRTDLWSLGVVLYEMLTGELPFKGDHDQTVIHAILHREPKPPSKITAVLPSGLDEIVLQALAKKPDSRYRTMEDLREDLEAVAEGLRPLKAKPARGRILGINKIYGYAALALLALLAGLNVGGIRDRLFGRGPSPIGFIKLAVLPFSNLTGDPEQEHMSEGLTDEMSVHLGRLDPERLRVIGRTSVMRYKKGDTPVDQIGQELGVDYVLEGSAQRDGDRLHITAKLIQVHDQTQVWADTFDREMSGVLVLQRDLALQVARALALKLLPAEQIRLASVRAVDPEAYDACLNAAFHWKKLTREGFDTARRYAELALAKDPSYAPAHAALALSWAGPGQMGISPPLETGPKAKEAALRAIALDANSLEALFALACVKTWIDWDLAGAEPVWRRALEVNPSDASTQAYYGHYLAIVGRIDEAIVHSELALELDPFNALFHSLYAAVLNFDRRYDDAMAAARAALALQPDLPTGRSQLKLAMMGLGMHEERLAVQRESYADDLELLAALERGSGEAGYKGAQRRIADVLAARYGTPGGVRARGVADTYFEAGDYELAIDWLEKSYEEHDPNLLYLGRPIWDPMRSYPRFLDLLRKIGLPADDKK